jgi:hypothetical protein
MPTGLANVLLLALAVACLVGCAEQAQPAVAPPRASVPSEAHRNRQVRREQSALERRRSKLQKQVLVELRKLRESRQASTGGAEPAADEAGGSTADCELLVFGGTSHEVFLGCLSDEHRPDSVFNMAGEHGSDLSPASMRNKFAPYGSNYDDTSACNPSATHPPVVVSAGGKSLGLLSMNPSLKRRITAPSVTDWLARMCGV